LPKTFSKKRNGRASSLKNIPINRSPKEIGWRESQKPALSPEISLWRKNSSLNLKTTHLSKVQRDGNIEMKDFSP
jgi:hypothetical protein